MKMKPSSIFSGLLPHKVRIALGLAVVCVFVLHSVHLLNLPLVEQFEHVLYDARVRATMPGGVNPQVVIVDIDEKSLQEEGRWPWQRARLGELVQKLTGHYKVAVLGMDVVYAEAEPPLAERVLQQLSTRNDAQSRVLQGQLRKLQTELDGDAAFARAMAGHNVVLGYYFKRDNNLQADSQSGKLPAPACDLQQLAAAGMQLQNASGFGANLAPLQDAAAGGGHFVPNQDEDGVIRSLPLLMAYQGQCYEALSMAVLRRVMEAPQVTAERNAERWSRNSLSVGAVQIPVQADATAWVPYRGGQGSFSYVSASDVLHERVDVAQLEGAVALLGTTAPGLLDARATPVGNPYAGVEVHANMIAGMLDGSVKKSPTAIPGLAIWLVLAVGVPMAILMGRAAPLQVLLLALAGSVLLILANLWIWLSAGLVLPLAASLLLIGVLFMLNMSYGFLAEERTKRLYKERFGQYVSPEVIEEMIANPQVLESMEGSSRNMTVLFSDIRNFTTISEGMQPKDLMRLMNEYLTPMTRLIIAKDKFQGTIDKYIGDAIMAFWGAPLFDENHARHGVLAALEMQQLATQLSAQFQARGWPEIRIGIGLNTGTMAVGNMGSSFRRAYTVLGDPVNLAARLEGLTKEYGVGILVSETTSRAAPEILYRELDRVRVKGKDVAVSIYEPLGLPQQVTSQQLQRSATLQQALAAYRAQRWDEAEAQLASLPSEDAMLVKLYAGRIALLRLNPPGSEWDGVTTFTSK
jgi:adenylate cyclase